MLISNIDIYDLDTTLYIILGDYLTLLADHEEILHDDNALELVKAGLAAYRRWSGSTRLPSYRINYVELIENLESRISKLTKELGKRDAAIEGLKKVIEDRADAHAKELECRVDLIKDEANTRISELTKELGKRDVAIEDLKRSADREIADLQKKIGTLGKNSDYLENMNYYKKAYEVSVGVVHRLEDEKEALYEDLDKANMRIEELEKLYKNVQDVADELMECCSGCLWAEERASRDYEAEALRRDIATLEELVAEKENAFHKVTCKLNESKSKVKELTGLYDQACDYIDELEEELKELHLVTIDSKTGEKLYRDTTVSELTSYLDDLSDEYYKKAEAVHSLETKIHELTARIQELETELNEAYTLSEDRRRLYNDLKRNYDDLITYVECLQKENADLTNLYSRDMAECDSLCDELEYSRKEYDSLTHDYMISESNVQALEKEIERLEKELKEASK